MAAKKTAASARASARIEIDPKLRDPVKAQELFTETKKLYLSSEQNPMNLEDIIKKFEMALTFDPAHKDAEAYLNYAKRDLSGLQKKKKLSTSSGKSRSKAEPKEDISLTAAYDTGDEENRDEDVELYGEDEEAEAPPWDPVANIGREEERNWEGQP